jgi:hypothetical protein
VSPVARFRPFGRRPDGSDAREPDPWLDDPPPPDRGAERAVDRASVAWDVGDRDRLGPERGRPSVPATRAATPAMWAPRPAEVVEPPEEDRAPVTDPFGFPPVPPLPAAREAAPPGREAASSGRADVPAWAAWVPDRRPDTRSAEREPGRRPVPARAEPAPGAPESEPAPRDADRTAPDPAAAVALAGAFAADYLSWDEDDPARRGRALADHLAGPGAGHALLGWSGAGRQRADIVLPGAVRPDGDGRLLVDVRVRVTPYRRVSRSEATPEPDPRDALGTPAAAPSVTARGWRGLAARWVRLGVTVVQDGDGLVVDVGEETFDAPDERRPPVPAPPRAAPAAEDPTLDGDDVVAAGSRR